ncbi:MAG: KTSC domain-containing protein [Pseudorhodoplanes sp.]
MPSSVIRDIDYDPGRHWLTVTFVSGRIYRYDGVPEVVFDGFRHAASKGQFFNSHIRDRFRHWEIPSEAAKNDFVAHMNA